MTDLDRLQDSANAMRELISDAEDCVSVHKSNIELLDENLRLRNALQQVHDFMSEDHASGDSALWTMGYSELFNVVEGTLSQAERS